MKPDKGKKSTEKITKNSALHADKKSTSKLKKHSEDDDDLAEDDELDLKPSGKKGSKSSLSKKRHDEDDADESEDDDIKDDWEKPEEEEEWDPDFDEFDVPVPKGKKGGVGKKGIDIDDSKIDDDFKDMDLFNDQDDYDEEDDDY